MIKKEVYEKIELIELIVPVLIGIAYITLAERKILGSMQRRTGPVKVGIKGILQSISDGVKLIVKESIIPIEANKKIFIIAPIIGLSIALILWMNLPLKKGIIVSDSNYGVIVILAITSIGVYSVIYSGWASNSKYAYIGSIRATAQILSYEISIGIIILTIISINESINISKIIENQIYQSNGLIILPILILFIISILAETLRSPFDIVEAESELVAGNIVEYGGLMFASMYLAEYSNIIMYSSLTSIFFFGQYITSLPTLIIIYLFILIRGTLPRLRWDQLLILGWTKILPLSLGYYFYLINILISF